MTLKAHYDVLEGKLHKGGVVQAEVLPESHRFLVKLIYDIQKKMLVPFPGDYLKGEYTVELPLEFKDEQGYLELEQKGSLSIPKGQAKFIKRIDMGQWKKAYEVEVLPQNGKFKMRLIYHPEIQALGWAQVDLIFLMDIPLLKNYDVTARFRS